MTWVKVDDTFPDHPKVIGLTEGAVTLWLFGLCYCSRHATDGQLPAAAVARMGVRAHTKRAGELVDAGLWERTSDGFAVVDYLEHQRSRSQIDREREQARKRQAVRRKSRRDTTETHNEVTRLELEVETETDPSQSLTPLTRGDPQAGDGTDDGRVDEAIGLLARRAVDRAYPPGTVRHPKRLLATVTAERRTEHGDEARRLVATYPAITAAQLADVLDGQRTILAYLDRAEAS